MTFKENIAEIEKNEDISSFKKTSIVVLSSYTLNGIKDPLTYFLYKEGFNPDIHFGGYDQFIQELLDKESLVYQKNPNVILLALSSRTYLKELVFLDDSGRESLIKEKFELLKQAVSSYSGKAKILITTLEDLHYSPYGIIDSSKKLGIQKAIASFNLKLEQLSLDLSFVELFDFHSLANQVGTMNLTDEKMFYLGKILLTSQATEIFAKELTTFVNAIYGNIKKCLVVDLDNTLWGGVIGEDGVDGIKLGETTQGEIYIEVQKIIKNIKNKGTLLAIVSKNNLEDVSPVFKHPHMILKEEDFILKKINWQEKSKNIEEIAKELNIGLNSLVFLDDNPAERLEVKERLPMVDVLDFPQDISLLPLTLKQLSVFDKLELTEEDKKRHQMYQEEQERKNLKKTVSLKDYLSQLGISIEVAKNDLASLDRITQLINKTNQFNIRTKRYTKEEVKTMMEDEDTLVTSVRAYDKFGELGLTGVIIITSLSKNPFIDSFLVSCRILSRKIEHQFFLETLKHLDSSQELEAEFIPTAKNKPSERFYDEVGFTLVKEEGTKTYRAKISDLLKEDISWIHVK